MRHRILNWALFLAVILSTPGIDALAQTTITIGTGTSTASWPVYMTYEYSRNEAIYTASQINAAGWTTPGVINSVAWYVSTAASYTPMAGSQLRIYMENTTQTELTTGNPITPSTGTLVYSAAHPYFNTVGWQSFTLSTPFCWDGMSNLLIRVERDDTYWGSGPSFRYTSSSPNYQHRRDYQDGAPPPNWRYRDYNLPNVQLSFTAGTPQAYVSSTSTQANTSPTGSGQLDQEILGIEVVTSGCGNPLQVTSMTLNTAGSTSAADILNAKVYFTGASSTFAPINQFGSTVVNPNGTFTVTGTQNTGGGTNHFWLAYDISPTAAAGNVIDAQCSSITVAGTPRTPTVQSPAGSRTILAPFSGTYTIDQNGTGSRNFVSFTEAVDAMMAAGVVGHTHFDVAAGIYNEQVNIPAIPGVSATTTVTFDGGAGNASSRIITYSVATSYGSVVTLNGADYLRFRNLTINSTNASYGYAMLFTAQADYNEVTNCILNVPNNTSSSYHIPLVASSTSSYGTSGNWANYNLIKDNTLNNGYRGVSWYGAGSTSYTSNAGNQFIGNTIQNWYYYGFYGYYHHGTVLHDNVITQLPTSTSGGYGLYAYYFGSGSQITNNSVWSNYYAARLYYFNYYQQISGTRAKVQNNMFIADGTTYNSTMYATYIYYPRYVDFTYNSLYSRGAGTAYGIYHTNSSGSYNNQYLNNYVAHNGNSTWYPIYAAAVNSITQFDYNAFYRIGTGTDQFYWNGSYYTTLASLQTSTTGVHDNSKWGNPYYVSNTDLHSRSIVGYQAGTPVAGVTTDFDGQPRSATAPCIGADEYPQPPNEYDLAINALRVENADQTFAHIEDPATHKVSFTLWNSGLADGPANLTVNYKVGSAPADASDGVSENFAVSWDANNKAVLTFTQPLGGLVTGSTTVYARLFYPADQGPTDDVAFDTHEVFGPKVHGYEDFEGMQNGTLPLTYDDGYLPTKWSVIDNNGGATMLPVYGPFNGSMQALTYWPLTNEAADEWVVSPPAYLIGGSSYRIGFEFYNFQGEPVTIECAYGASPDPTTMTTFAVFTDVAGTGGLPITAKQLAGGLDPYFNTPNVHQDYFLAIRFTTQGGGQTQFSIDKIMLDDNPSPPPKIAYGMPGDPIADFIDDPAYPIVMSATYKAPGLVNKTFAVASSTDIYGTLGD
ncbi:MAG: BNR-repeat neuraminidase N-terminal domain-containing protein, partial [Bacteroidota bacterium]|nr:BNR-repeat neuraminidase N-terminal domain-containing protein [Bacteroidota bacterium]